MCAVHRLKREIGKIISAEKNAAFDGIIGLTLGRLVILKPKNST